MNNFGIVHAAGSATTKINGYTQEAVQPNAIDIRLNKVFRILPNVFEIDAANNKKHRGVEEIQPDQNGFWYLEPGEYEISCMETVEVGPDEMGLVVQRSSISRNSCYLRNCVFDAGYKGEIAGIFGVNTAPVKIQRGTRIGQYVCYKSEVLKQYDGSYGFGKEIDDQKYGRR